MRQFATSIRTILILLLFCGCGQTSMNTTSSSSSGPTGRWMDRQVYLALSGSSPQRNNIFQKNKVKTVLNEIQSTTSLGAGYFTFTEIDEGVLQPVVAQNTTTVAFKSFILIWPDDVFNDWVMTNMGGSIPDTNGVMVINSAHKREFYMILKSSCFDSASAACNYMGDQALYALIARQMGLLVGMNLKDCTLTPYDAMCATSPTDSQWSTANKLMWANSFNNVLETILANPNYYDENNAK